MNIKFFSNILFFSFIFLYLSIYQSFAAPGVKITEPQNGTAVIPGENIIVRAEAVDGFNANWGTIGVGQFYADQFNSLPASFTVPIPLKAGGTIPIGIAVGDAAQNGAMDTVSIIVKPTAPLVGFDFGDYRTFYYETDWNSNVKPDEKDHIYLEGVYADNITREISYDKLTFTSGNATVVSVDNQGNIKPLNLGKTTIAVTSGNVTGQIAVEVSLPSGIRPKETTPPTCQIDIKPGPNPVGWYNQDLTITLTAQDNEGGSGIREITYSFPYLNAKTTFVKNTQTVIPFSIEGINLMRYGASDKEGNDTGQLTTEIKLDKTLPLIAAKVSPQPNPAGWNKSDVTVSFDATDKLSGVKSVTVTPTSGVISTEGSGQVVKGVALDIADNEATASVTVNLDKTGPTINLVSPIDQKSYVSGQAIPLTWTATDNLSGIAAKTVTLDNTTDITNQTQITPSAGQHSLIINATDKVGNTTTRPITFTVSPIAKIKAEVTIKPEVFLRNKGIFIALVRLPSPYQNEPIAEASCDGAKALKIISCRDKGAILIFRRQDITQKPIDTTFVVTGKLKNGLIFEGTDIIKKVFSSKDRFDHGKDKDDEHKEFHDSLDRFCGQSKEGDEAKKHIKDFDD